MRQPVSPSVAASNAHYADNPAARVELGTAQSLELWSAVLA
ncbi:hypothetical protein [Nocardia sp. NPDC024068]